MGEYYFHLDQLTVGYNGKPLIDQIQVGIHKGIPLSDCHKKCHRRKYRLT